MWPSSDLNASALVIRMVSSSIPSGIWRQRPAQSDQVAALASKPYPRFSLIANVVTKQ